MRPIPPFRTAVWLSALVGLGLASGIARADSTPQALPFFQDWSNTGLITTDDDWSHVPGIVGYRGDGLAGATGVNPQTILGEGTAVVDVNANKTDTTFITGGVTEFEIANPVVALQGSGTARAPNLVISVNTSGQTGIHVSYSLRDIDANDNSIQPVALQYRVGGTGNFTNLPAGFVADASAGPGATQPVTAVSVSLPTAAENQPLVQIRIITTDAVGSDEWIGIDDISVTGTQAGTTNPSGAGTANPNPAVVGDTTLLTVSVTPGANPPSTSIQVSADLSSIGGPSAQSFGDDGGNSFSFLATVLAGTAPGAKTLPVTISDHELRTGTTSISLTVNPPPPPVGHPVISQIYGGGGNSGATFQNDYVELYNPGTVSFDLTGWSIQYAAATGSFSASNLQPLAGVIAPGEFYLVGLASGGAVGAELPVLPNVTGTINMSATTGKVALVSNSDPLTGGAPPDCPSTDGDLVDFVGYGGSANCREGATNAPAPSNSTALLRKNGGALDTDSNGTDLVTGTPNPRRTSPIAEVGPRVQSTDPATGATQAPRDASATVTFSEDVTVDAGWYHVSCAVTGNHDDATVYGGPRSFVITPNVNFAAGESCTVTLLKDSVHDVDTDDAGPNTDTLPADYVWAFTVTAPGTPPPYPAEVHLTMGNPSGAVADVNVPDNYLMEKPEYALSYNRTLGRPNWVSWHLDDLWTQSGALTRVDTSRPDPAVPPDWYRVQATDFFTTGFDRGHMTPNADREFPNSLPINQATFLMSNMVAQAPDNNQGPWANLENYLRTLLPANEIYIVSGPAGAGGTGSNGGTTTTVAGGHVTVPAETWKVALVLPKDAGDDVSRVTASTRTIAVIMPNIQGIKTSDPSDWRTYLTTVDAVEALTGYDFFSNVDPAVQNAIEAGTDGVNPPGVADQTVTGDEDTPKDFVLRAVSASAGPLTYFIDTPPTHGAVTGSDAARTYVPVADFFGTDTFRFHVSDGVKTSNTATVTVNVLEVNDPPTAGQDAKATDEDVPLVFAASDLTANDVAGPANESDQVLTVTSVAAGADTHGTVTLSGGQVTYVPEPDFNGTAAFTYQVCDDGRTGGLADPKCVTGTVEVMVSPVNDPPVFTSVPGPLTAPGGSLLTFTVRATDVDSPALSFSLVGAPAGAAIDPVTGQFSWTPTAAQTGPSYAFDVTVSDGIASAAAPVTIAVVDLTPPMLALPADITAVASSPAGAVVTYSATASDLVDGARPVTCLPASGSTFAIGTTTVSCSASDTHGNGASGSFRVTVSTPDLPGRMIGDADIDLGPVRHHVSFAVQERATGADAGALQYRVTTRERGRDQEGRFDATAITSVSFFDVPGVSPGHRPPSGVDTVSFGGVGRWNGRAGYRFDAVAVDAGEPGRRRDAFRITVQDASGQVVASVDAEITAGNIQSLRIGH